MLRSDCYVGQRDLGWNLSLFFTWQWSQLAYNIICLCAWNYFACISFPPYCRYKTLPSVCWTQTRKEQHTTAQIGYSADRHNESDSLYSSKVSLPTVYMHWAKVVLKCKPQDFKSASYSRYHCGFCHSLKYTPSLAFLRSSISIKVAYTYTA